MSAAAVQETAAPVFLGEWEAGSEDWLAARAGRLGGSETAAVLGLSPWQSRFGLYQHKRGIVPSIADRPALEWGRLLEPVVADKWLRGHPEHVDLGTGTWQHPHLPWMIATPDRWLQLDGNTEVLEIKTAARDDHWGPAGSDEYPVWYRVQVIQEMEVMGARRGHLAVLIGGSDYREYIVERDDTYDADLALMVDAGQLFVDDLANSNTPDIDSSYATYEALKYLHPEIDAKDKVDLDPELGDEWVDVCRVLNLAKSQHNYFRNKVAAAMRTSQYATHQGRTVARRQTTGDSLPYVVSTVK